MTTVVDNIHHFEIPQDDERERIARLPYLFRGISLSKFLYSSAHPEGTPRPASRHFWGQWAESLGTACSYAFSAQHELDRSYENTRYPGIVLITKKTHFTDFSAWKHQDDSRKNQPPDFREYDCGRNPRVSDAEVIFISEEHYREIDKVEWGKIPCDVHTYSGEEVNWFEEQLGMGDTCLVSNIRAAMLKIDPNFSPPVTEASFVDADQFGQLELTVFDYIKAFSHQQIMAAYRRYSSVINMAFNPEDQRDQQEILQQTEQLLQTLAKRPFETGTLKTVVGIAYFLAKEPHLSSDY